MSAREYKTCAKRVEKLDAQLSIALDKLKAARDERRPEGITTLRVQAEALERETEDALNEALEAHRQYWRERAEELRKEMVAALVPIVRYRQAVMCTGQRLSLDAPLITQQALAAHDGPPPADLGEIPTDPPDSPALDRAEDEL